MELVKDKEFQQEVELKKIDPEMGTEVKLNLEALDALRGTHITTKKITPISDMVNTSPTEIDEAEELFHGKMLDFGTEEFQTELHFETEDLLPESVLKDEIIKLISDELNASR